jgi:hypothetical protein
MNVERTPCAERFVQFMLEKPIIGVDRLYRKASLLEQGTPLFQR